ncbi:hypothetical protein [Gordonia soli]|uniref:Uncharacterized protein n=1 Tax=Gordonia soli NBRC 108243 TaxID=1223545 RepID=M0QGH2_9ACTN|nr:hypothetical protein [Gordonia soli]GAC67376.1 hypothetical protein GS4_07_01250 [Gordonia soli NBRC 108243]
MLDAADFVLHGLTLRQLATGEQLADIIDEDAETITTHLDAATADGKAIAARGAYMITPAGRTHLDGLYPEAFAAQRGDPALVDTLADFEQGINKQILAVMTSWQTVTVDGAEQPNDHSDADHDAKVIDKLARLHDRATVQLAPFADADPLTKRFLARLEIAQQRVDQGDNDYVSNVRIDSYHTVWYQMHEHLLRVMGEERDE